MKSYTYEVQIGGFIKSYKTLAAARAKFASVTVRAGGVYPDVVRFDPTFAANGEMCVYGEFESPSLHGWNTMLGTITREEAEA